MRMFQFVSRHSSEQSTAHGQLYRSWKVSPTLFQTDLRITDHRGHKFPLSLTLLSVQNSDRMIQINRNRKLSERSFQPLQWSRQQLSFSTHRADLVTKTDSTFPAFSLRIVDFEVQFFLRCSILPSTRSDARVKFDSGVIFLNQSQFFANA